jgi:hypothetical protein
MNYVTDVTLGVIIYILNIMTISLGAQLILWSLLQQSETL